MNSKLAALVFGLAVGMLVSQVMQQPRADAQQGEKKSPWEYKIIELGPINLAIAPVNPSPILNQQAAAGWEFVSPISISDRPAGKYFAFLLKRPKEK